MQEAVVVLDVASPVTCQLVNFPLVEGTTTTGPISVSDFSRKPNQKPLQVLAATSRSMSFAIRSKGVRSANTTCVPLRSLAIALSTSRSKLVTSGRPLAFTNLMLEIDQFCSSVEVGPLVAGTRGGFN